MGYLREKYFQPAFAEALTQWRLDCMPPRRNSNPALAMFHEGLKDIVDMRLRILCMPLFQSMERIEKRYALISDLYSRVDVYAPPTKR